MILVLDHYDSFVYNLVQLVQAQGRPVRLMRSDEATAAEMAATGPEAVILSPGSS
jgi:anthranilate/para-aminobenzoate synthase component II